MGRYKDPNSRRSLRDAAKAARLAAAMPTPAPEEPMGRPELVPGTGSGLPSPPAWLSKDQADLFRAVVSDLAAAKVPLKRIDCHAITMLVNCMDGVREATALAEDPDLEPAHRLAALKLKQTLGRDLIQWLPLLGAVPIGRARLGQKAEVAKPAGPLQQLLAKREAAQRARQQA